MSQAKVDQYKEYKQNRKANLEKEKKAKQRQSLIWKIVIGVLGLALVTALVITAVNEISRRVQARPDYERDNLVIEDVAGIFEEESSEEATEGESKDADSKESEKASEAETESASAAESESASN